MIATKPTTNGPAPPTAGTRAGATTDQRTISPQRKTAFAAGALYLLSFVSIPTLFLYNPLRASNYILGHGSNTGIIVGAILEMIVALAGIGTAVALFPVVKRQNEGVALGFVGTRTLEGGAILAGVACVLSLVTLQQAGAGTGALATGHALITMYDRIFLLSQSFIPAVNGLLIGSLLYQSRLVPRWLPLLGFVGATLLVAGDVAVLFGLIGQHASTTGLLAIPIAVWEFSLGVYLVVKGFKPSAITALYSRTVGVDNASMVPVAASR
jgi:hypothetical protein